MGIKGLSTFLGKYHSKYNDSICLHDCCIIIDGNNLMYYLLSNPRGPNAHLVGGDYVSYAKKVREFFQHLKNCKITPIVIFDGAYEPEKWKTVFRRYKESVKLNVHSQMPGNSYTPIAMATVFREILVEQGILHYQTQFEGDDTMAFVAKKLNCPLLSSDSDFYIYPDIQNIPLGSIEYRKSLLKKSGKSDARKIVHVLAAKILSMERLCKEEFKFRDLRLLPLAAVILGNDRISSATFSNLHKDKGGEMEKWKRIKYIFDWLGKHRDYDHVLSVILQSLKESERKEILNIVKNVLLNYQGENGEIIVWNSIVQDLNLGSEKILEGWPIVSDLPEWYLPIHTSSTLPTYLLQILRNRTVLLQPQVEVSHHPSTHVVSIDIVRITAGILLGESEITLVTRERKNVVRVDVKTITELPGFGPVPNIFQKNFRNKAQAVFYSAFQLTSTEVDFANKWPTPLKFLIMNLIFFCKKVRKSSSTRPLALGFLLTYLKTIFQSNQKTDNKTNCDKLGSLSQSIREQTWTPQLVDFFHRFDTFSFFSKTRPYEISYVTIYSQFQCLLVHSTMLSKLLGNPFRLPKLQHLNSHFIYNVTRSVAQTHSRNTGEFLNLYFGNSSENCNLLNIFTQFFHIIDKTPRLAEIQESGVAGLPSEDSNEDHTTSTAESDEDQSEDDELNVEILNRFSKLRVSSVN